MLSKDVDAMQPHVRPSWSVRWSSPPAPTATAPGSAKAARSSKIDGVSIADVSAMQITDLAEWVRGLAEPSVAPLLRCCGRPSTRSWRSGWATSLNRPSGTLSGGEAQRTKMIRHLGSALTDVTYVFDEPTIGLHATSSG